MAKQLPRFERAANCILLTGATGVVGSRLLIEILETTSAKVYCLIRSDSVKSAAERLRSSLKFYDPAQCFRSQFDARVIPVLGDVSQPRLGINLEMVARLQLEIDWTIHTAANTNLFLRARKIDPVNVQGTQNVIQFALATRQKQLAYISTYTVMGDRIFDRDFVFTETQHDVGQGFENLSYQASKFRAEKLVRDAGEDGLNWNIFRLGQVFGDAQTGLYPLGKDVVSGLFYDIFKTAVETGVAINSRIHFDMVPVDFVAKSIVALSLHRDACGETYHLTNPDVKAYNEVIKIIGELGYRIKFAEQEDYKELLFSNSITRQGSEYRSPTTAALKWWFSRDNFDFNESAVTDCSYTQQVLRELGVACPPIDRRLIEKYFSVGIRQGYFPAPAEKATAIEVQVQCMEGSPSLADITTIAERVKG